MDKDYWNATLYDSSHHFVSKYGESLMELLLPKKGEHILDLGCGTGDLANEIADHGATVIGIDQSENMIKQAKEKYPFLTFEVQDAKNLLFYEQFDAVFSNATLHWIKEPFVVLQRIYNSLKPNGRFVAEFGGAGNVQLITSALIHQMKQAEISYTDEQFPWYFPTIGQYTNLMEQAGFHVTYAYHFNRPTKLYGEQGLRNWLEMFSPSLFENLNPSTKEAVMQKTIENLYTKLYTEDGWYADYKRLRVVGYKL